MILLPTRAIFGFYQWEISVGTQKLDGSHWSTSMWKIQRGRGLISTAAPTWSRANVDWDLEGYSEYSNKLQVEILSATKTKGGGCTSTMDYSLLHLTHLPKLLIPLVLCCIDA